MFTGVINQVKTIIFFYAIALLFGTSRVAPCWPLERTKVKTALASFIRPWGFVRFLCTVYALETFLGHFVMTWHSPNINVRTGSSPVLILLPYFCSISWVDKIALNVLPVLHGLSYWVAEMSGLKEMPIQDHDTHNDGPGSGRTTILRQSLALCCSQLSPEIIGLAWTIVCMESCNNRLTCFQHNRQKTPHIPSLAPF